MIPEIVLAAAIPLFAGLLVPRLKPPERAWHVALAAALGSLVLLTIVGWQAARVPGTLLTSAWVPGIGVDGLSAPVLPFLALLGAALLASRPAGGRTRAELGALLATEGALVLLVVSTHFDLVVAAWLGSFAVALTERHEADVSRRPVAIAAVASSVPLVTAWGVLVLTGAPRDLATLFATPPPEPVRTLVWGLVVLAALVRIGVFPFQSWVLSASSRSSLGLPLLLVAARPGAWLLLRVASPLTPDAAPLGALASLAALSAIYGGLVGLAQTDPRRALGAIAVSQSGIIVAGVFAADASGITGARVQWLHVGLSLLGLALVVEALEARLGRERLLASRGLATRLPALAAAFVLFALASVGFPGTLGWVGEDLIVRGTVGHAPGRASLILIATGLNGILLMRTFHLVFLGPAPRDLPWPAPMVARERWVLGPLLVIVAALGTFPQPLLDVCDPAAIAERLRPRHSVAESHAAMSKPWAKATSSSPSPVLPDAWPSTTPRHDAE